MFFSADYRGRGGSMTSIYYVPRKWKLTYLFITYFRMPSRQPTDPATLLTPEIDCQVQVLWRELMDWSPNLCERDVTRRTRCPRGGRHQVPGVLPWHRLSARQALEGDSKENCECVLKLIWFHKWLWLHLPDEKSVERAAELGYCGNIYISIPSG